MKFNFLFTQKFSELWLNRQTYTILQNDIVIEFSLHNKILFNSIKVLWLQNCDYRFTENYNAKKIKMSKATIIPDEIILSKIYTIRDHKVMLDKDLAEMYNVETKQLKRQVKRNIERFPDEFMFELTSIEFENLRSQNGTTSWGGARYLPFAFTEHGVLMLSSVLNSPTAIQVNINIIKVFTRLREIIVGNKDVLLKLAALDKKIMKIGFDVKMHDGEIETIFSLIDEWRKQREEEKAKEKARLAAPKNPIGFKIK